MEMNPKICIYMASGHGFHYNTWVVGEERNSWEVTIGWTPMLVLHSGPACVGVGGGTEGREDADPHRRTLAPPP